MLSQQYYQGPNVVPINRRQRYRTVNNAIPGVFTGLLGAVQLFLWIAIIILEILSVYYDGGRGTVYAGFWCSTIFFLTWVSMLCYLCCGKSSGCGSYLVVLNAVNSVFTIALLVFTSLFVNNPCLCLGALCRIPNWESINEINGNDRRTYSCTSRTLRKKPVLIGLLVCAVLLLVCSIVFIMTYLIVSIRLRARAKSLRRTPAVSYQQYSPYVHWSEVSSQYPSNRTDPPLQQQRSYQMHHIQRTAQWPSAPSSHQLYSEKF